MLGTPANMIEIQKICSDCGIKLIEDTAWGCGGEFQESKLVVQLEILEHIALTLPKR